MGIYQLKSPARILVSFAVALPAVLCMGFASAQETDEHPGEESLLRFIEIGGVAEVTVSRNQVSEGESSTSTAAEQLEMGVGIEPHPWIGSEFGWIHEHEEDHGEEEEEGHGLGIFTGTIIVGPPDGRWWLKGGVQFLPFTMFELAEVHAAHDASIGPFETGAIVDPLSFEYGSKREKSLLLGVSIGQFLGSVYGYRGDDARSDEPRSGFGAAVGYKKHVEEEEEIAFNLSYIDDLGTLAGFQEEVFGHEEEARAEDVHGAGHSGPPVDSDERMPGWSVATAIHLRGVAFSAEYMISQDRFAPGVLAFDGRGARPAAWSLEAGYGFELAGRGGELTLGYQGTSEASGIGLPSLRYLSALTVDLWKDTLFGTIEWIHDREYGTASGGSGEFRNKYTLQLGLAF